MKTERVMITGCGGMLGSAVYPFYLSWYKDVLATDKNPHTDYIEYLDVREEMRLKQFFMEYRPDLVLHLAAETDLEFCETHPDAAIETNVRATANIARLCEEYGSTLIYISTAGVFDGKKIGHYTETDKPRPIMVYGQTKYDGELVALKYCSRTFVVRAGWMMGGGRERDKKFIYQILKQIGDGKKEVFAVTDRWGTPTYTLDFAMNLSYLIATKRYGVYHMVCEGNGTRFDVAQQILKICRCSDIKLTPTGSDFFSERYFAPRPVSEMLYNQKLRDLNLNYMRPWCSSLQDYIEDFFPDYIYYQPHTAKVAVAPINLSAAKSVFPEEVKSIESMQDRRRAIRFLKNQIVNLELRDILRSESQDTHIRAYTINRSASGVCLYIFAPIIKGQRFGIRENSSIQFSQAIVKWVSKKNITIFKAGLELSE